MCWAVCPLAGGKCVGWCPLAGDVLECMCGLHRYNAVCTLIDNVRIVCLGQCVNKYIHISSQPIEADAPNKQLCL